MLRSNDEYTIESIISSNPTYQIISVVLCNRTNLYDPFHLYTKNWSALHNNTNVKNIRQFLASKLDLRTSEIWHVIVSDSKFHSLFNPQINTTATTISSVSVSLRSVNV